MDRTRDETRRAHAGSLPDHGCPPNASHSSRARSIPTRSAKLELSRSTWIDGRPIFVPRLRRGNVIHD